MPPCPLLPPPLFDCLLFSSFSSSFYWFFTVPFPFPCTSATYFAKTARRLFTCRPNTHTHTHSHAHWVKVIVPLKSVHNLCTHTHTQCHHFCVCWTQTNKKRRVATQKFLQKLFQKHCGVCVDWVAEDDDDDDDSDEHITARLCAATAVSVAAAVVYEMAVKWDDKWHLTSNTNCGDIGNTAL